MLVTLILLLVLQGQPRSPTRPDTIEAFEDLSMQAGAIQQSLKDGLPVYGKLIFPSGMKENMLDILLEGVDGSIVDKTISLPNGQFRFDHVKIGRYHIVIEGERFENVRQPLQLDARVFGAVNVDIRLYPRPGLAINNPGSSAPRPLVNVPRNAQKEFEKGLEEQRKGDVKKAVARYEKALQLAPNFYEANLQLGLYHLKAGNRIEATRLIEQAVKSNPISLSGRLSLARLYLQTEEFKKVIDTLKDAPYGIGSPDVHFLIGLAHYKLDELSEAEQALLQSVQLAPDTMGPGYLQLYNLYMKTRQPAKALRELDTYLEKFPNAADRSTIQDIADKLRKALSGGAGI